jgi:putative addiction module component (TIGR02574 family)
MSMNELLDQASTLSVDDRIQLAQAIWESIPEEARTPNLTDDQKAELDSRLAELQADPGIGLTWEQIRAQVKGQR